MTNEKYEELWSEIVLPSMLELDTKIDGVQLPLQLDSYKEELFICYEEFKDSCKELMSDSSTNPEEDIRIDRHKIAAALSKSILETSPFSMKSVIGRQEDYFSDSERLANYVLAWNAGISVIYSFFLSDDLLEKDHIKTFELKGLRFPKESKYSKEGYEIQTIKTLFLTKNFSEQSIFLLSNIFYLIEQYNILLIKGN